MNTSFLVVSAESLQEDWFGSDALPWISQFDQAHTALSLEPENGISKSCKLRVGKKRVPQREKMGFVTRRQDTKQSKATDILALFLYLKSFSGLLITIRMNSQPLSMKHKALHDLILLVIKPHLPVTVWCDLQAPTTLHIMPDVASNLGSYVPLPLKHSSSFSSQFLLTLKGSTWVSPRLERSLWTTLLQAVLPLDTLQYFINNREFGTE